MKRENYTPFILGAIVLVAAFFRLYDVPNRALMGNETVRDAVVGLVGARELQLPVTGPFSSLGAFTFGPWYWYHLIASYWIFPTPYAAWYMLAFMSLLFVVVLFGIGLVIGGPILGLVAAFLAAIAPNQLTAATHLTQPNLFFGKVCDSFGTFCWDFLSSIFRFLCFNCLITGIRCAWLSIPWFIWTGSFTSPIAGKSMCFSFGRTCGQISLGYRFG